MIDINSLAGWNKTISFPYINDMSDTIKTSSTQSSHFNAISFGWNIFKLSKISTNLTW